MLLLLIRKENPLTQEVTRPFQKSRRRNQDEALLQLVIRSSDSSTRLLHRLLSSRTTLGRIKCKCLSGISAKMLYSCRGLTMQTQRCPSKGPGTIPALPLAALPCCQPCKAGHHLLSSCSRLPAARGRYCSAQRQLPGVPALDQLLT